jgi:hypothetical protein
MGRQVLKNAQGPYSTDLPPPKKAKSPPVKAKAPSAQSKPQPKIPKL